MSAFFDLKKSAENFRHYVLDSDIGHHVCDEIKACEDLERCLKAWKEENFNDYDKTSKSCKKSSENYRKMLNKIYGTKKK